MLLFAIAAFCTHAYCGAAEKRSGDALSIYPPSPYYFQNAKGKPTILIGDYTWGTFSDVDFDYVRMLDSLKARGLNIARVWLWWGCEEFPPPDHKMHIEPFLREGSALANDGRPKYNLAKSSPAFFTRLRDLCRQAQKRGISLQLVMMDAWMIKHKHLWRLHAFNRDNNTNGVDGDPRNTGTGTDPKQGFCSLGNPNALKYQKAYILKVVDKVNEFDNVYFEIANENYYSEAWELALCDAIKARERTMPRQHMTIRRDFPSHSYVVQKWDPAAVHAGIISKRHLKVPLLFDTDWTINKDDDQVRKAAWSAVASGGHFDYMDDSMEFRSVATEDKRARLHKQIDYIARFVKEIAPWEMTPDDSLVESGLAFAMGNPMMLFAYLPTGGKVTLNLGAMKGSLSARWYNPRSGEFGSEFGVSRDAATKLSAPDRNDWALLISRNNESHGQ